jgi:hypothetical protein
MKRKRYEKRDEKGENVKEKAKKGNDNWNIKRKRVQLRKTPKATGCIRSQKPTCRPRGKT